MNRFIVADSEKCIGCRTCEVACVVSHQDTQDCAAVTAVAFSSRIRVIKGGAFTTAVACHQCEDAPCANVCPTQAIRSEAGVWRVEQSRCIGCKSCMVACPFGAMQVAVVAEHAQALKCDLCAHRADGPACVAACPTHALSCVDPARLRAERLRYLA
ncbi:4Fe-4S binding protein [Enterobacter soli]|jgi:Fe-S-cluster-containing hydrogenase component 2|uniref:4Fe-4S binding protein n=1 Tax=Enterobacter soli TaxID=885040 RepID=A0AAW8HCJ2_9ENTR|nr:4Fe-4S binding protein [Enterobacter soli]HDR2893707.1 4Fe-4S binding protein [Enterobacter asburiae]MDD9242620.1 4Fe-4S binding protein [Enterobacter soli]MDQ2258275.1 4Fe-4S binding protein [Enterobacter soli]MDQ2338554.1 4Fe-4S binding protein [Enterobacter soli]HEE9789587.1 4Fe-4S binding protein [Enterobacter soli]